MLSRAVGRFLKSTTYYPFFITVGDENYCDIKNKLSNLGLHFIKLSDYCKEDDKLPDLDALYEQLKTTNKMLGVNTIAILGLGEYLALCGKSEVNRVLTHLQAMNTSKTKVVLLLRGVSSYVNNLCSDIRFDSSRFFCAGSTDCNLSITVSKLSTSYGVLKGFKALLNELENGKRENIIVNTNIDLSQSLFTKRERSNAYDEILFILENFSLAETCGTNEYWSELLKVLTANDNSLEAVLEKYGLTVDLELNIHDKIFGREYRNWLFFIALKINIDRLSNSYLRLVLENTHDYKNLKLNLLNYIINISHTDKKHNTLYLERKDLIRDFPEPDIAEFIIRNRKNLSESIYKLTDNTIVEREEIIAWVSQNGIIEEIAEIYPVLNTYLKKFVFNCGDLSDLLTNYFSNYKEQKVSNKLNKEFIDQIEVLAENRIYNRLPTRNEIIDKLEKSDSHLYWLDALGVEYLSFFSEMAREYGLYISIKIARAELPTITSINRNFFDDWQGNSKEKDNKLDDIKHSDEGGYNYDNNVLPIHLAKELEIIETVIKKAATALKLRKFKRFLVVSDHGASRLAVLMKKEEKYETNTKGEHSGRCCKLFEPYDLPFAAEENGYLVLADYGRFKGSRAANVEVHGGAALEEVIVPIIELTLKDDSGVVVELDDSKLITVDYRTGTEIILFINYSQDEVSVIFNNKRYFAEQIDNNHYKVELTDMKRAGEYLVDVYSKDNLIATISFKAHGKSGKIIDEFNDLF
ncbi:hypothetical protein Dacet_0574 [Denitrovibrio acetiphilus DSM 12809]|uniref:BREX-4 system phosphatase PglZ n=1 Tax=Denitrovibrio acetiphilus (strain DSM 12809 / NBRC 114555 / N2460) TaxID=522772 RepID=D4H460_DENA2|nr:BREX-4 system phosphatase PglZ [Denitrovibrio acetiphilus]ADD67371.1 hypothetical protein Dacet_0574 [Denitrovibrio acetiphilus DSM 12809]